MFDPRPRCRACAARVRLLHAVRWDRRTFCGRACMTQARDAHLKARCDVRDHSPTVCRCSGAPAPLDSSGIHCARCRRMFSAGVRHMLATRTVAARRPVARLLAGVRQVMLTEVRLPRTPVHRAEA